MSCSNYKKAKIDYKTPEDNLSLHAQNVYNRETGETILGYVPPYSVVVPGTMPSSDGKTQTYAAIIVKTVDEKTRSKTSINDLLRG